MDIYLDEETLKGKSSAIAEIKKSLEGTLAKIEDTIYSVDGVWQGDAEKAFEARLIYVKKEYRELLEFYDDCVKLLNEISEESETKERELVQKINLC